MSATSPGAISTSIPFSGESLRPLTPVNLSGGRKGSGDLVLSWTRRSRDGFAWLDGIDAPLGEASEQYRVNLSGVGGSHELISTQPWLTIAAADVATLGGGPATVDVQQIGDAAASRSARVSLIL